MADVLHILKSQMASALPYQVLPPLTDEEYQALKTSISEKGILVPIEVDTDGNILDGHHRAQAAKELGIEYETRLITFKHPVSAEEAENAKRLYALEVNVNRRQLTPERRRVLVVAWKQQNPKMTTREIGKALGVSHETVASDLRSVRNLTPGETAGQDDATPEQPGDQPGEPAQPSVDFEQEISRLRTERDQMPKNGSQSKLNQILNGYDGNSTRKREAAEVALARYISGGEYEAADGRILQATLTGVHAEYKRAIEDTPEPEPEPEQEDYPQNGNQTTARNRPQKESIFRAVNTLSGTVIGLKAYKAQTTELDPSITAEEAGQWVADLSEVARVVRELTKLLKERTRK